MAGPAIEPSPDIILHASCVALQHRAVLICGGSGAGKSALALNLMAHGAGLVADDRTCLVARPRGVIAFCPPAILGRVEARGIGILNAVPAGPTPVSLIVDLDHVATDRFPRSRRRTLLNQSVPLLHKVDSPHFAVAILQYLKTGPWKET